MSTTSKAKPDNQNLTRTRSLGRKPKLSEDGSDHKPEKPLPNYLKPTISSRPDPVKFLKKNHNNNSVDDDKQKLLRRRSFDRPISSLTSPSTSSSRIPKSLNVSPSRPRDRPVVPREKSVTALRSSSFHGSRSGPKGGNSTAKSSHVVLKKTMCSNSTSLKNKKEGSANAHTTTKASEKEIALDSASLSSAQEDHEEEDLKVEEDQQPKEEKVDKEVEVDVVQADQENESTGQATAVSKEVERDEEDKTEEKVEETKEQNNKVEEEEEIKKKIDEDETPKNDNETVEETTEEEEVKEEEKEKAKEEEESSGEGKKREVMKGIKKESPSAYNDVIASKMQENPRKNKVLALAGAFQTVIDYETAASK